MTRFTESTVELAALDWLAQIAYVHLHGAWCNVMAETRDAGGK